jgi:hypothetical protein
VDLLRKITSPEFITLHPNAFEKFRKQVAQREIKTLEQIEARLDFLLKRRGRPEQRRATRTRGGALTSAEEFEARQRGEEPTLYRPRKPDVEVTYQTVKALMDYIWQYTSSGNPSRKDEWLAAARIPEDIRLKLKAIQEIGSTGLAPYPGYHIIVAQSNAGWKAKIGTTRDLAHFQATRKGESQSATVRSRSYLAGARTPAQHAEQLQAREKRLKTLAQGDALSGELSYSASSSIAPPACISRVTPPASTAEILRRPPRGNAGPAMQDPLQIYLAHEKERDGRHCRSFKKDVERGRS